MKQPTPQMLKARRSDIDICRIWNWLAQSGQRQNEGMEKEILTRRNIHKSSSGFQFSHSTLFETSPAC